MPLPLLFSFFRYSYFLLFVNRDHFNIGIVSIIVIILVRIFIAFIHCLLSLIERKWTQYFVLKIFQISEMRIKWTWSLLTETNYTYCLSARSLTPFSFSRCISSLNSCSVRIAYHCSLECTVGGLILSVKEELV